MSGVREIVERAKRREAIIMTSVITQTEILQSQLPAGMERLLTGFMRRIQCKSVDMKIAKFAHDLRDYYVQRKTENNGKTLATPDALHLATAILYRAEAFHTFDESNGRNSLGLIPLSENVAGHRIKICKPEAKNPELDLGRPPKK
jgi:predicted nucleic acid-binding protein